MKTTFAALMMIMTVSGVHAQASGLSGTYFVKADPACGGIFNEGTIPSQIDATASTLSISQGKPDPKEYLFFKATLGDQIFRPDDFMISHGYHSTNRQIASYDSGTQSFLYKEYLYDMSVSDAQGLATGLFKTIQLKADGNGGVLYTILYSDGEIYHCSFVPMQ